MEYFQVIKTAIGFLSKFQLVFNNYILNIISAWANYSAILVTGRDSFNQNNAVTHRTFHCNQHLPLMELFCNFPLADL